MKEDYLIFLEHTLEGIFGIAADNATKAKAMRFLKGEMRSFAMEKVQESTRTASSRKWASYWNGPK